MGTAIVAIPREDDYVWNISSEKIPHMTLLFLGDQANNPKLNDMVDYIQHAVETSLSRFGMQVDRRGVLGTDNADVLFFDESWNLKNIERFRGYLLKNSDIFVAYAGAQQFDGWTPHLTLGYPATPAKKDSREYPGISYVFFDKIAIWTGDFEGPTFDIPSDEGLSETFMSDPVDSILAHHGVRGMRWGVRRSPQQLKTSHAPSADSVKAKETLAIVKAHGTSAVSNADLKNLNNRLNLEKNFKQLTVEPPTAIQHGKEMASKIMWDFADQKARDVLRDPEKYINMASKGKTQIELLLAAKGFKKAQGAVTKNTLYDPKTYLKLINMSQKLVPAAGKHVGPASAAAGLVIGTHMIGKHAGASASVGRSALSITRQVLGASGKHMIR